MTGAVVLHSGGQDSTTCLAWAIEEFGRDNVYPVSFDYRQKHAVELGQAQKICKKFRVRDPYRIDASALSQLSSAALTNSEIEVSADASGTGNVFAEEHGLPSTFVPGRNMLFFTLAMAYGAKMGIYDLVTGVCEADDAGYPDCRASFVAAAEDALCEALDEPKVFIHAPLLRRSKAETFSLAAELGVLNTILEDTHTCYHGDRSKRFPWGYGCGECPACKERENGWNYYLIGVVEDPA